MNPIYIDVKGQTEEQLCQKAFFWFTNAFPDLRGCLFHVPNGGNRNAREGKRFKQMGVVPGVADLILLVGKKAYLLEAKKEGGRQSQKQVEWELLMKREGFTYIVFDSLKFFKDSLTSILSHHGLEPLIIG